MGRRATCGWAVEAGEGKKKVKDKRKNYHFKTTLGIIRSEHGKEKRGGEVKRQFNNRGRHYFLRGKEEEISFGRKRWKRKPRGGV